MKQIGAGVLMLSVLALAGQAFGADEATIQKGDKVYEYCYAMCHGPALPGTMALQAKYRGSKPALLAGF